MLPGRGVEGGPHTEGQGDRGGYQGLRVAVEMHGTKPHTS